jgi:uncharacterized protein with HEPN domain
VQRREWFSRLEDIVDFIQRVETSLSGLSYDDFEKNADKSDAAIRNLTVIGEAANHVPEQIQGRYPNISWAKIVAMRNFVVHEYFGITLKVVWDTAKEELPKLRKEIANIVAQGRESFHDVKVTKKKSPKKLSRKPR